MNGLYDWPDLEDMLSHIIPAFDRMKLRLLDISCARADYFRTSGRVIRLLRPLWPHFLMGGASLSTAQAESEIGAGLLDMITWGRFVLANPDLVSRMKDNIPLRPMDSHMLDTLT